MTTPFTGEKSLLRLYVWLVVLVTLLTLAVGAVLALHRPASFSTAAKVEVMPVATRGAPIAPDMGTERELATSGSVAEDAATRLDTTAEAASRGLSVSVVADATVLVIGYTAATPQRAFDGADAFARSYLEVRNARQNARAATMITKPVVPRSSAATDYALVLTVALVCGLGLGLAAAWLWDRLSDRVRSSHELERAGRPVVAGGVSLPRRGIGITARGREDFRFLAGRLDSVTGGRRDGVRILVTAPRPECGASAVALNVAASVAALGRSVILVDADLRARGVSALLPGVPLPGLLELLGGSASVDDVARPIWLDGVRLVPSIVSKPPPPTDVDLTALALGRLASRDVVVIDAPPLLEAPETALLADHVDVVLLVADLGSLRRSDVARAMRVLEHVSARFVGWVSHDRRTSRRNDVDQLAPAVVTEEPAVVGVRALGPVAPRS